MLKDNIKKARLDAGLTQLEVAEKLGVAQAQYARWENGGRNPPFILGGYQSCQREKERIGTGSAMPSGCQNRWE